MKRLEFVVDVTEAAVRRFAEASGDFNPIHLDEVAAHQAGLPGRCAHGLWVAGLAGQQMAAVGYPVRRISARFERAVLVGSRLHMQIEEQGNHFDWVALSEQGDRMAFGEIQVWPHVNRQGIAERPLQGP